MADDQVSPVDTNANEPGDGSQPVITDPTIISKLRDEIKGLKQTNRDLSDKWKTAEPVLTEYQKLQESQKTEAQKLLDRATEAERKAADREAAAERAINEAKLTRLAARANVDLELLDLIDISKLDLNDEKATLEKLGKLAAARTTAGGASNPGRGGASGPNEAELQQLYFGGGRNKPTIFGGN